MINFKKLVGNSTQVNQIDPIAIHKSLDAEVSHSHLRDVQREALDIFHSRRSQRDLVLKMSTGSGKTTVGLLMLKSYMAETQRPGVYLCPTRQLVQQVIAEAKHLGLKAESYISTYPSSAVIRGEQILVTTYEKMFNARSTFDRPDVDLRPVAIVLDDAHAGAENIRKAFTIVLEPSSSAYTTTLRQVASSLRQQNPGKAESILQYDPRAIAEIPYWTWQTLSSQITGRLTKEADSDALRFTWGFVSDDLPMMRCIIGGKGMEISPEVINFRVTRTYYEADHRIFMSATLADDALLVRDLDCEPDAARQPIVPQTDRGLGERMVLVPTLFDRRLSRESIQQWLRNLSKQYNVVVLAPSIVQAKTWERYGARAVSGDEVDVALSDLRQGTCKFVAIANRYDGIDLPDDACRVIVIDGLPQGDSFVDALDRQIAANSDLSTSRNAHRIEQGMGRAVRSPSDYAVAILLGNDIEAFVAKSQVLRTMGRESQAQIQLAHRLVDLAKSDLVSPIEALHGLVCQCLQRDEGWKEFYRQEVVGSAAKISDQVGLEQRIRLAAVEREALNLRLDGDVIAASNKLTNAVDTLTNNLVEQSLLLQRAARYIYPVDPSKALELQKRARSWNSRLLKPLEGVNYRKHAASQIKEADRFLLWFNEFQQANAAIAAVRELRDKLQFDNDAETFEEAIKELGIVLGAVAERPEQDYGHGPDNIWLFPQTVLVIEAKNTSHADRVPKIDGVGQLHNSRQWAQRYYPELHCVPVICHRQERTERTASPSEDMRVLTPTLLDQLLEALEQVIIQVTQLSPLERKPSQIASLLQKQGLHAEGLRGRFTKPLQRG